MIVLQPHMPVHSAPQANALQSICVGRNVGGGVGASVGQPGPSKSSDPVVLPPKMHALSPESQPQGPWQVLPHVNWLQSTVGGGGGGQVTPQQVVLQAMSTTARIEGSGEQQLSSVQLGATSAAQLGAAVGKKDGAVVGAVGVEVGIGVGSEVVGARVGSEVAGARDGDEVGSEVVGNGVGARVGVDVVGSVVVGAAVVGAGVVGSEVVEPLVGDGVGAGFGELVGSEVDGGMVGVIDVVGSEVAGACVGASIGPSVGEAIGSEVEGTMVGSEVVGSKVVGSEVVGGGTDVGDSVDKGAAGVGPEVGHITLQHVVSQLQAMTASQLEFPLAVQQATDEHDVTRSGAQSLLGLGVGSLVVGTTVVGTPVVGPAVVGSAVVDLTVVGGGALLGTHCTPQHVDRHVLATRLRKNRLSAQQLATLHPGAVSSAQGAVEGAEVTGLDVVSVGEGARVDVIHSTPQHVDRHELVTRVRKSGLSAQQSATLHPGAVSSAQSVVVEGTKVTGRDVILLLVNGSRVVVVPVVGADVGRSVASVTAKVGVCDGDGVHAAASRSSKATWQVTDTVVATKPTHTASPASTPATVTATWQASERPVTVTSLLAQAV